MLGDISGNILFKDQKVLILLIDGRWVLDESISELGSRVGTDKIEVESLTFLILKCLFKAILSAVLDNPIDSFFTL